MPQLTDNIRHINSEDILITLKKELYNQDSENATILHCHDLQFVQGAVKYIVKRLKENGDNDFAFSKCGENGYFSDGFGHVSRDSIYLASGYKQSDIDDDIKSIIQDYVALQMRHYKYRKVVSGTSNYKQITGDCEYRTGRNYVRQYTLISISGDGGKSTNFNGECYKKLAPSLELYNYYKTNPDNLSQEELIDYYITEYYNLRLKNTTGEELLQILNERFGEHLILLCYEDSKNFCHRRLVADFICLSAGITIPELVVYRRQADSFAKFIGYEAPYPFCSSSENHKGYEIIENGKIKRFATIPPIVDGLSADYRPKLQKLMK